MSSITIHNEFLSYTVDAQGVALLTIDQKNNPANLFSVQFMQAYFEVANIALADDSVKGVIVTSGQRMFMPGGDLRWLAKPISNLAVFFDGIMELHQGMRKIETGGKPFVAAINGSALGGGLELALSCHYRIALNHFSVKLGFPEVKLGLLPGGGGTAKAPYLLGIQNALSYLLQGTELSPQQALKDGLIHQLADDLPQLIEKSKAYILSNSPALQPWDDKKYRIPGGSLNTPAGVEAVMATTGNVRKLMHGNYPSMQYILSTIHDGLLLPIDRALEVEARYFTAACTSKEAKNMIKTGFLGLQAAKKGKARPQNEPVYAVKKLGILGAGMMGAGIAYVSAKAGMQVVLKDVSLENAEKGKEYSANILQKNIAKGYTTQAKADALLAQILPTQNYEDFASCDLVIEAVFENPRLKATVTAQTEAVLGSDKIFGSNTSTIPISQLAQAAQRPENFIGIHFFSPVDKMPLVEIIVGKQTSQKAIAAAVDFTVAIQKVPIVVNDSRGFFTSRCFGAFCAEGVFLLQEGVPPAMIENIAKKQGMPVGPLAVMDEVSLTLITHVYESDPSTQKTADAQRQYALNKMLIEEYGRTGKKGGSGFYDYWQGGKKKLWSKLTEIFNSNPQTLEEATIAKRIMHRQALESFRCLEEGVLNSATDGDIGSVLGWGFPLYTGGAISYISYVGVAQFIADCDDFTERFGERFRVSQGLRNWQGAAEQ